jgi:predicted nuclease with TOPRIM domain
MSTQYNRISLKYQIITVVLAVGSAIVLFVPIKQFKPFKSFSSYLMSASMVSFITTRHMMRDVLDEAEKLERENEENTDKLQRKIITITDEKSELIEKIAKLNDEIESLKFDASEQLAELETCQQAMRQYIEHQHSNAHEIVEKYYQVAMRKCVGHVDGLCRNYPEYQDELDVIKIEIEAKKARFTDKISAYNSVFDIANLIDEGLKLQELMIVQCIELRCKAQAIIIKHLTEITTDAVPFAQYEEELESLAQLATTEITAAQQKRKDDLQSIIQEFTGIIDNHKTNYINDVNDSIETAKLAVRKLEVTQSELQEALEQLEETKKPLQFAGDFTPARMGNSVSMYYYNRYRILLDALHWEETETGIKIIYSLRRNPGLLESEISADNSLEQTAEFCNALHGTEVKWDFNRQFSQVILTVIHRRTVKLRNELPRGVKTADKFLTTVRNWRRVRITGGSESGKSPTAENLVCAITTLNNGVCDFYDPMFDSVKNYRTISAIGRSHADSVQGLKDYQSRMQSAPSDSLYLAWFDEIDTTLEENPKSASDLKAVLKQSSHKNSGLIITGQNANVRNLKGGFDRSDMNNFVCVHIGDNYRDAIANSHLSESERSNLMKTGDALTDYCVAKNEEDGLDHTDAAAYRFALVLEPNKKPYFMILPEFGEYVWQEPTEATEAIDTEPTDATNAPTVTVGKKNPNCPDCGTDTRKNGFLKTSTERLQKYKCKNSECGREFV